MKRFLLFIFTTSLFLIVHPENKGFSRWSITPEYGYNYFDGDINQNLTTIFPTSLRNITYGGTVECALNPIWGVALDYYFFPLRANTSSPAPISVNTDLSTSNINATFNFTRWIFPMSRSKFYVNGSIGLGFAYYTFDVKYANGSPVLPTDNYVDQKYNGQTRPILLLQNGKKMKYGLAGSLPVTLSVEYNFSKPISIGAKLQYRAFTKDNLEGVTYLNWDGVTNDNVAAGTLFLRYKFNSIKKNHLRNIIWEDYQPDEGLILAKKLDKKFDKLKDKVDSIGTKVDSLMPRVARLEHILSNDGPDSDGDGVPDVRDLEPNTPPNTPVDFWGRALKLPEPTATRGSTEDILSVYFDFDRIDLDDNALITISKVAARMKADPSLYVEVRGYCDYLGNNPYNNLLSQRRSDRVKAELVNVWHIPFDHVISNGKGKVIEPRSRYKPNRRCDFFFGKL